MYFYLNYTLILYVKHIILFSIINDTMYNFLSKNYERYNDWLKVKESKLNLRSKQYVVNVVTDSLNI